MSAHASDLHQMASLGRLLAGIVHEINTPIGSIFSNNEVMLRSLASLDPLLAEATPEALTKARRVAAACLDLAGVDKIACERIRAVISGLKTFSRLDSGEPRCIDLNQHLRDTIRLTQAEFRGRVTVETDFGVLPPVECYPQMLSQVFLNLLVNAGQAIDGEGKIVVSTRARKGAVSISIADTGRGMTPEQQARVFEAGFTTKPIGEGTGLGLSISREIIEERHHGAIRFESRSGAGTTFYLEIPVQQPRSSQP